MLRIVHELNQLDFGGAERIVRNIIKFDKNNEHTVLAYKDGTFRKELEDVGAKVVVTTEKVDDEIDIDADVLHIHSGGGISELAKSLGRAFPVVETIHSPLRSPMPDSLIAKRVGVSAPVARMNSNATHINNGLDFEAIYPTKDRYEMRKELGIPDGAWVIGRLGRLGKDKGLEEWILACYYLKQRGYDFIPLIVGDEARDCEGYRGKLKLMCESLPLQNVIWAGHREDVSNCMQAMDIFLYPSPTEGFGLVFAEAMFNNVAVVTYKTDVTMELFGGYAMLSDKKDGVLGLVEKTERLFSSPELLSEFTGNPHSFIVSEYDAERMSKQYQELYEQCNADFNRKT